MRYYLLINCVDSIHRSVERESANLVIIYLSLLYSNHIIYYDMKYIFILPTGKIFSHLTYDSFPYIPI
jgi:hypothetical protein